MEGEKRESEGGSEAMTIHSSSAIILFIKIKCLVKRYRERETKREILVCMRMDIEIN